MVLRRCCEIAIRRRLSVSSILDLELGEGESVRACVSLAKRASECVRVFLSDGESKMQAVAAATDALTVSLTRRKTHRQTNAHMQTDRWRPEAGG